MIKIISKIGVVALSLVAITGCAASKPNPISYLSLEVPKGAISTKESNVLEKEFSRGGFYFFNNNFRPAPDLNLYIEETAKETNSTVLRNADIQLNVPVAIDILFFGINFGTDTLTISKSDS